MNVKSDLKPITNNKKSNANSQFLVDPLWDDLLINRALGESMVEYTKKVDEKISNLKKKNKFSRKHKKLDSNFILKLLSPQLGLL
jgi:hypothetical protein